MRNRVPPPFLSLSLFLCVSSRLARCFFETYPKCTSAPFIPAFCLPSPFFPQISSRSFFSPLGNGWLTLRPVKTCNVNINGTSREPRPHFMLDVCPNCTLPLCQRTALEVLIDTRPGPMDPRAASPQTRCTRYIRRNLFGHLEDAWSFPGVDGEPRFNFAICSCFIMESKGDTPEKELDKKYCFEKMSRVCVLYFLILRRSALLFEEKCTSVCAYGREANSLLAHCRDNVVRKCRFTFCKHYFWNYHSHNFF